MNQAFEVHKLNDLGMARARHLAEIFDTLLSEINLPEGRFKALVITKLEEACFFAKKALASLPENQLAEETVQGTPEGTVQTPEDGKTGVI